jgi:ribose transport system substrate-binding protein
MHVPPLRRSPRLATTLALSALLAITPLAPTGHAGAAAPGHARAAAPYVFYLSNNFVGNDWRVQMENEARVLVNKPPLKGKVLLKIENSDNTPTAQIASLNSIIQTHPAAILVDAASPDALNNVLTRACGQGILVLSFDQVVTATCAWKIESNWVKMSTDLALWMALTLHGKGNVFVDRGLAGAPISLVLFHAYTSVLARYPHIHIVGYFNGNYALGPEQSGVAALLAAHPNVDGILTQGYATGALHALQGARHRLVPVVGFSYNGTLVTCARVHATCMVGSNPAWLSALAAKIALQVLEGKTPNKPQHVLLQTPLFESNNVRIPGAMISKIQLGVNAFPNLPAGLTIPFSPPWARVTPQEVASAHG